MEVRLPGGLGLGKMAGLGRLARVARSAPALAGHYCDLRHITRMVS